MPSYMEIYGNLEKEIYMDLPLGLERIMEGSAN